MIRSMAAGGHVHGQADAEEVAAAAATRRVQENLAVAERLVHPGTAGFLGHVARPWPPRWTTPPCVYIYGEDGRALAGRLRRGEAMRKDLVAALERQAVLVVHRAIEAFTASVRWFRAVAVSALPVGAGRGSGSHSDSEIS